MRSEPRPTSPSMWEAIRRLADASQRLLVDRLELVRLETREDAATLARALALLMATLPLLLAGWLALMAGVTLALLPVLPLAATLCILGGVHVVVGGAGAYLGISRLALQSPPETSGPETERAYEGNGKEPREPGAALEQHVVDRQT
jgi:uncharacterized membrane protein YqjE